MVQCFIIEDFTAVTKNTLVGFARVPLPSGMVLYDVAVHQREGTAWDQARMTALPQKDRAALGKILTLLASDQFGKRDAAICAPTRLLDRHGLRWSDLLAPPPPPKREPLHAQWRTTCAGLAKRPGALRGWERRFVADLPGFPRISTKQRYCLASIAERVLGEASE